MFFANCGLRGNITKTGNREVHRMDEIFGGFVGNFGLRANINKKNR